jgi:hypothetical protein
MVTDGFVRCCFERFLQEEEGFEHQRGATRAVYFVFRETRASEVGQEVHYYYYYVCLEAEEDAEDTAFGGRIDGRRVGQRQDSSPEEEEATTFSRQVERERGRGQAILGSYEQKQQQENAEQGFRCSVRRSRRFVDILGDDFLILLSHRQPIVPSKTVQVGSVQCIGGSSLSS